MLCLTNKLVIFHIRYKKHRYYLCFIQDYTTIEHFLKSGFGMLCHSSVFPDRLFIRVFIGPHIHEGYIKKNITFRKIIRNLVVRPCAYTVWIELFKYNVDGPLENAKALYEYQFFYVRFQRFHA